MQIELLKDSQKERGERKRELCFVWNPEGEKPSVALGPLMD